MPVGTDTTESTRYGKAYEFVCLTAFQRLISQKRPVSVIQNSSYAIAKQRFEEIPSIEQSDMIASATVGAEKILSLEPRLTCGSDNLVLSLQADSVAKTDGGADIRDLILERPDIQWNLGISIKHNHNALKHSRLSNKLDFGEKWYGKPCSATYFNEITPIFSLLEKLKGTLWSNMPNKVQDVYQPLLNAFKKELIRANSIENITESLIRYLIGCNGKDYYKLVHRKNNKVDVTPYNITGKLNQPDPCGTHPSHLLPGRIVLPTKIESFEYKKKRNGETSNNTLVLELDKEWSISFRIHSASSLVETSLKFDVQLAKHPSSVVCYTSKW